MSYCPDCGAELDENDRFCRECGYETEPASDSGAPTDERRPRDRDPERRESPAQSDGFSRGQMVVFAGAAVTVVGAFLPWVTIDALGISRSGIDADGVITLVLALVAGGGAAVRWGRWARVGVGVAGALTAGIGLLYVADPLAGSGVTNQLARAAISPGSGLYVTALGGLVMLAGPILDYA